MNYDNNHLILIQLNYVNDNDITPISVQNQRENARIKSWNIQNLSLSPLKPTNSLRFPLQFCSSINFMRVTERLFDTLLISGYRMEKLSAIFVVWGDRILIITRYRNFANTYYSYVNSSFLQNNLLNANFRIMVYNNSLSFWNKFKKQDHQIIHKELFSLLK